MKHLKYLKYFSISIASLLILIIIAGVSLAYIYEDDVEQLVISELNKQLLTEISVEDVNFSLLKKFPYASLDFKNILIKSSKNITSSDFEINSDTLCYANHLFLEFNINDIFAKKYKIKNIILEDALVNVLIDSKGNENYHFWKTDLNSKAANNTLNLKKIELESVSIRFINKLNKLDYKTFAENATLSGNFSDKEFEMEMNIKSLKNSFSISNVSYGKNISLVSTVSLNVKDSTYSISKGIFNINDVKFSLNGNVIISSPSILNLQIEGKDIDINSFLALIPESAKNELNDYSSKGHFFINCKLTGKVNKQIFPHIEASFGIENAEITDEKNDLNFKKVNLTGLYSNGKNNNSKSAFLKLNNISAVYKNSSFKGSYTIENLATPKILIQLQSNAYLEDLNQIFNIDTLEIFNGKIEADIKFQGFQKNLEKYTENDYKYSQIKGFIKLKNANIKLINDMREYKNISGDISVDNSDLVSDSLFFNQGNSDFLLTKVWLQNIVPYILFNNKTLILDAVVNSQNIDLNELLSSLSSGKNNESSLLNNVILNLQINAKKVKYNKFHPTNLKCDLGIVNNKIIANNLNFNAMEGFLSGDAIFTKIENSNYLLKCQGNLKSVNITSLFTTFDNFDQDFIIDKHLKGFVSARINFSSELDKNYDFILPTIKAESNVEIINGELINFEPLEKLSSYVELSELKHIKFSKLSNDIFIKNEITTIPTMNISSSAMSIDISGFHQFNNEFDYRIKVLLSDVLSKKFKNRKIKNEEFGAIEDDGIGKTKMFLKIIGNPDDYKISYDTKQVKAQLKENLKEEKSNLKQILNSEFGWFKKDSSVIKTKQKEPENIFDRKYNIVWDEENTETQK